MAFRGLWCGSIPVPVFRQGLSLRFGRGFQGSRVHPVLVMNSPPMVGRSTGGRDPNHSDKRSLLWMNLGTNQRALKGGRLIDGVEMLLEDMLRFLAEMPADKYHDYRDFRHRGLRGYLINRFLREKWNEDLFRSSAQ